MHPCLENGSSSIQRDRKTSAMPTKDSRHLVREDATQLLGAVLRQASSHLTCQRRPTPDMLGHLADRQVYRKELERIGDYIRDNWPQVRSITTGDSLGELYFSIEVDSHEKNVHRAHWPIETWIKTSYPSLTDFVFFFHGPPQACQIPRPNAIYPDISQPSRGRS